MEEMAAHAKTLKANHDATFSEPMKRYCIWKWHVCTFTQVGHTRLAFRYNICLIRKGRNPLGTLGNAVVRISWKDECPYWAVWAPIACVQPFEKMPIQSVHSSLTFCLCMYSRPRVFVVCLVLVFVFVQVLQCIQARGVSCPAKGTEASGTYGVIGVSPESITDVVCMHSLYFPYYNTLRQGFLGEPGGPLNHGNCIYPL